MNSAGTRITSEALRGVEAAPLRTLPFYAFDQPSAMEFAGARAVFLDNFLASWTGPPLHTAFDAGTGVGFFAGHLAEHHGLRVTAQDARASNVAEAQRRHPSVEFFVGDVEDPALPARGTFDIVTALGLLYHLENPFRAVRSLAAMTRQVLVIESIIAPGRGARAWILDEFAGEDQAPNYVAWHLTETSIVKLLYRAGMPNVYRARFRPQHLQFRGNFFGRQARTFVLGSRSPLAPAQFERVPESFHYLDRAYYLRLAGRAVLRPLLEWRRGRKSAVVAAEETRI
jgi:hypothetical protein